MNHHQPRKRFGQHFLHDPSIINSIVNLLNPKHSENLLEIGPGLGALTQHVLPLCEKLTAIELDRDVIPILQELSQGKGELIIHQGDVLRFDFKMLPTSLRIFGNLPYNISTPILFHLLSYVDQIQDMLFMLQKEVVDRIVAAPDTEHYGRLSVMVQYWCHAEKVLFVPASAFKPPPRVQSAVIRLLPYTKLPNPTKNFPRFTEIVRDAFNQRRKTLRNSLKNLLSKEDWNKVAVSPDARPETLSVADFVALAEINL